ncbi:hypothetical protein BG011_008641 [Mortierella polycephala]|uniref:Uncharacterized protein n=1 Tax=Mortierella polycephala TaxID=41804 RepID=A0A9P6PQR5_9FUNG|nr:hypothetical protein BG011_008641 [Mortierella polycephala]
MIDQDSTRTTNPTVGNPRLDPYLRDASKAEKLLNSDLNAMRRQSCITDVVLGSEDTGMYFNGSVGIYPTDPTEMHVSEPPASFSSSNMSNLRKSTSTGVKAALVPFSSMPRSVSSDCSEGRHQSIGDPRQQLRPCTLPTNAVAMRNFAGHGLNCRLGQDPLIRPRSISSGPEVECQGRPQSMAKFPSTARSLTTIMTRSSVAFTNNHNCSNGHIACNRRKSSRWSSASLAPKTSFTTGTRPISADIILLSPDDQHKLQQFWDGQISYPPPPPLSPGTPTSISFFPDLEEQEKDKVLKRTSQLFTAQQPQIRLYRPLKQ